MPNWSAIPAGFITVAQAAKLAHAGVHTVRDWAHDGKVKAFWWRSIILIDVASLEEYLKPKPYKPRKYGAVGELNA